VQVGLVGLGRMGANMSRRWLRNGHTVFGYARTKATVDGLVAEGAITGGSSSLSDLVAQLEQPRVLWLMVPAASVDATLDQLKPLLAAIPTITMTSAARRNSRRPASAISTAAPAVACGASSAATAS